MGLVTLLLPRTCAVCGVPNASPICAWCRQQLVMLDGVGCARCGAPGPWRVMSCAECVGRKLGFVSARSCVAYTGAGRTLVHSWKENGRRDVAAFCAELMRTRLPPPPRESVVTWVPGDKERRLERGDVAPARLARALGRSWSLASAELVHRTGTTPARNAHLTRAARAANVQGRFGAATAPDAPVVLVDDVYTTGATASACALALRSAGASAVYVVTFARSVR